MPHALGIWLLSRLLLAFSLAVLVGSLMPEALELHFMRGLELGQLFWGACWGVAVVELMLQQNNVLSKGASTLL